MKLADWQKKQIEPTIHDFAASRHNDLNIIYAAFEKACSGGMRTNGPDNIGRELRKEIEFFSLKHGNVLSLEQRLELERTVRGMIRDLMP
jgi:hypothetical protein